MLGRYERRTWQHDPSLDAPPRYRRACSYDVFIPLPVLELGVSAHARPLVKFTTGNLGRASLTKPRRWVLQYPEPDSPNRIRVIPGRAVLACPKAEQCARPDDQPNVKVLCQTSKTDLSPKISTPPNVGRW
jgi:hypothetical protein